MVIDADEGLPPEWSPFNMRQYNLSILKPPISKSAGSSSSKASMSYTTASKSLDLLRQTLQRGINQEIKGVIAKYIDPGIENIRNNLGPESVTDDHIQKMCRQILEEAKRMFPVYHSPPSPSSCNNIGNIMPPTDSDYHHQIQQPHQPPPQQPNQNCSASDPIKLPLTSPSFAIKRESDTDSEASSNASKKPKKAGNKSNNTSATNNGCTTNISTGKPKKPSGPSRKHVAQWDSTKFTPETLFIMGAKANKALGFAQTRGRLYVKHPGLFKYASDTDDKEWLSKNKLMPATGGRAYIMLLEDIEKLARDNKLNVTINYEDIKGFRVPDFILEKMKSYINTWKKQYIEDSQRSASSTSRQNRANNAIANNPNLINSNQVVNSMPPHSIANANSNSNSGPLPTALNPPPPPPPPPPLSIHAQIMQPPHPNPHNQQSLNSYHMSGNPPGHVVYEPTLMPLNSNSQQHELTNLGEYIHMEKPPPMYPGHSTQHPPPQQHPISNHTPGGYVHQSLNPIEDALNKGDWSSVSDRSLLQFALQSSRAMSSWDPQDSFDLIESVTNGSLGGPGTIGDASPLLQISPDTGTHLTATSLGSPELSAVLDQAFQYPDT